MVKFPIAMLVYRSVLYAFYSRPRPRPGPATFPSSPSPIGFRTSSAPSAAIASKLLRSGTKRFHPLFFRHVFFKKSKNCSSSPKNSSNLGLDWWWLLYFFFWRLFWVQKIKSSLFFSVKIWKTKKKQVFSWDLEFETNPQLLSFLVGYLCWQKCIRSQQTPLRIYGEKISLS